MGYKIFDLKKYILHHNPTNTHTYISYIYIYEIETKVLPKTSTLKFNFLRLLVKAVLGLGQNRQGSEIPHIPLPLTCITIINSGAFLFFFKPRSNQGLQSKLWLSSSHVWMRELDHKEN